MREQRIEVKRSNPPMRNRLLSTLLTYLPGAWIDPKDNSRYLVACDGGVYESFDKGENWIFKANLPITQFYDVAVASRVHFTTCMAEPRTISASGVRRRRRTRTASRTPIVS